MIKTQEKTINASDFKAKCLGILDDVQRTGVIVTILKHGKAVAQLHPYTPRQDSYPQLNLMGSVKVLGDIVSPAISSNDLDLEKDKL